MHPYLPVLLPDPSMGLTLPRHAVIDVTGGDWGEGCPVEHDVSDYEVPPWYESGPRLLFYESEEAAEPSPPIASCLAEFLQLQRRTDLDVARFAARWGALGIEQYTTSCRLRVEHDGGTARLVRCTGVQRRLSQVGADEWVWEPVAAWRHFAGLLATIMRMSAPLASDAPASPASMRTVTAFADRWFYRQEPGDVRPELLSDPEAQRKLIADLFSIMLRMHPLVTTVAWSSATGLASPTIRVNVPDDRGPHRNGLGVILVMQSLAAIASPLGVYDCDGCGRPYVPSHRRPKFNRRRYCPECNGGGSLAAKRDSYHRKAAARRGSRSGDGTR